MSSNLIFDIIANDKASGTISGIGKTVDGQAGTWDKWKGAGIVAAAAVGAAVLKFGTDSVAAFTQSQEAQKGLEFAFEQFPALADTNVAALQALNAELARKTGFDDDATAAGQASLAQFGLTGAEISKLTPLMADYAAKTGVDMPTAADQLGKAMLGQGRALKGVGIDFVDTGSVAGNLDQVMAGLTTNVGGYAEEMGGTAAGKTKILKDQFGELQEKVGEKLMPALNNLTAAGLKVVDWLSQNSAWLTPLAAIVGGVALAIGIWAAAQWVINAAMAANPIGFVIIGIAALVAGIVWIATKTTWFQTAWTVAWGAISGAATAAKDWIVGAFGTVVDFVSGLPGKISSAASGMWDGLKNSFRSAINWIIGKWNDFRFEIGGGTVLGVSIPKVTLDTPNLPMLATGGSIASGGLAIVGERGPELVSLPTGSTVYSNRESFGAGNPNRGGVTIGTFNAGSASPAEIWDEIEWRMR